MEPAQRSRDGRAAYELSHAPRATRHARSGASRNADFAHRRAWPGVRYGSGRCRDRLGQKTCDPKLGQNLLTPTRHSRAAARECALVRCRGRPCRAVTRATATAGTPPASPRPASLFGMVMSHWNGKVAMRSPRSRRLIDGQVNRDASPDTESPGASSWRRPRRGACRRRGVLRVGARAGPARTAARAVPGLLAEQDSPEPLGLQWL